MSGTWSATLQIQVTADGVNRVNLTGSGQVMNHGTGAYMASGNITANGIYQINAAGVAGARVITTAYTSGTVRDNTEVALQGRKPYPACDNASGPGWVRTSDLPRVRRALFH